jgi:phosphatidylserine decarboxylase
MRLPLAGPGIYFVAGGLAACIPSPFLGPWGAALAAVGLGFAAFSAYFFRDPDRMADYDPQKVYSPGDGTVLSVRNEDPGNAITIRIFLAIWNVHVQRAPIAGTAEKIRYQPGGFALAMKPEARMNERNSVLLRDGDFQATVEQIAGFIARRVACWTREGERLAVGQRIGMIYFGSQVALHLPLSCRVLVKPGDKVTGGLTPVAQR